MEQLILSVEKNMNGRQLLSLVINDRYSTGEQEGRGHLGRKEECGSSQDGVYIRMQHIASRK